MDEQPQGTPKVAATPPLDPSILNGADPGPTGAISPEGVAADPVGTMARQAADIQSIRREVARFGPLLLVLAWFAAMAIFFLSIIARRLPAPVAP